MGHINRWDIRVERRWTPVYTLGGKRYDCEPTPPMSVEVSAEFDDNTAAMNFERRVRELLEITGD